MSTGLDKYIGGTAGSVNDRQKQWLMAQEPTVASGNALPDSWFKFLRVRGYTGTVPDMMLQWARATSGSTGSLMDALGALGSIWSPSSLFALGEQGVWYDPSDMSTLFQDSAGTVPVTAAGQPVGRMLDKSGNGNHQTQATAASRPILREASGLWYLELDGVDDYMQSGAISFVSTGKVSTFASFRKASDAVVGVVFEFSEDSNTNSGAFSSLSPSSAGTGTCSFRSRGTLTSTAIATGLVAPVTLVVSGYGDVGGDIAQVSVSGVLANTSAADQGTGNYGNYPLYLFRRGGSTFPLAGRFYGLLITGRQTTGSEADNAELYEAAKAGVVI